VRRVIEPLLAGGSISDTPQDDIRFVVDLGLCRFDGAGGLVIANPIYKEVLPRVLAYTTTASLPHISPAWLKPDGSLDPDRLLAAFLAFWRQHGQPLLGSVHYHEIAPHLVLMAFLHRVVNGNGALDREYAIGSRRMDLCLRYGGSAACHNGHGTQGLARRRGRPARRGAGAARRIPGWVGPRPRLAGDLRPAQRPTAHRSAHGCGTGRHPTGAHRRCDPGVTRGYGGQISGTARQEQA
jgi:hypothetical protein